MPDGFIRKTCKVCGVSQSERVFLLNQKGKRSKTCKACAYKTVADALENKNRELLTALNNLHSACVIHSCFNESAAFMKEAKRLINRGF
jgi:hypothetical protein